MESHICGRQSFAQPELEAGSYSVVSADPFVILWVVNACLPLWMAIMHITCCSLAVQWLKFDDDVVSTVSTWASQVLVYADNMFICWLCLSLSCVQCSRKDAIESNFGGNDVSLFSMVPLAWFITSYNVKEKSGEESWVLNQIQWLWQLMSDSDAFPAIICCSRSRPYLGDPDLSVEVEQLADRFTAAVD